MSDALHASYHEAITQLEHGFIRCELPNEVPAPDSGRLPFQLPASSSLLTQVPHGSQASFWLALALLGSDLYI